ncbi:MAG: T9SS C-terminal target domain-containing protein [Sphingobacteriales bacterium]|nr:MAG: T9SS C-terminal target domain-containing protein [Sphingobacteriales bacterium]
MKPFINFIKILILMKKIITTFAVAILLFNFSHVFGQVTKTPLLEEFTSSTCGPCAANNPTFDAMLMLNGTTDAFVCVKYQMNWPGSGDVYYNSDGSIRRNLYAVTGIPELAVEGTVWSTQPAGFLSSDLTSENSIPSNMVIDAQFILSGSTLTVFGNFLPQQDISGSIRRYIAIVERHTYNNASSNGETEFSYVEQKMLPNGAGTIINGLVSGAVIPYTQTIDLSTISNIEDINNLMYAVWVQNSSTKEVLQSTWATFPTGIQEPTTTASGIVNLFPNPSSSQTILNYQLQDNSTVSLKIINAVGQVVEEENIGKTGFGLHQQIIDIQNFAYGIYFIDLQIGNNHYRQPLMVQ